jgi:hypothetical protein
MIGDSMASTGGLMLQGSWLMNSRNGSGSMFVDGMRPDELAAASNFNSNALDTANMMDSFAGGTGGAGDGASRSFAGSGFPIQHVSTFSADSRNGLLGCMFQDTHTVEGNFISRALDTANAMDSVAGVPTSVATVRLPSTADALFSFLHLLPVPNLSAAT